MHRRSFVHPYSAAMMAAFWAGLLVATPARGGSIFLTGHDPDFHAQLNENPVGAQHIVQRAISFATDPLFNPFAAAAPKFLFVEAKGDPGASQLHRNGVNGILASGYVLGTDFDHHDATTLNAALDGLGSVYGAIVIASDYGGILKQAELDILNARATDIATFLNAGGGLVAMAESNNGDHLTPHGGRFGFLPFLLPSTSFNQTEDGNTVTPFGLTLGLTDDDVNGNFSHNVFTGTGFGLQVVDFDAYGEILSLAGRSIVPICPDGVVEAPESCDPPGSAGPNGQTCRADCTVCGDGTVQAGDNEQCDDGNLVSGDGCSAQCHITPICGNHIVEPGEGCDPPGSASGAHLYPCRADCTVCGDGVVQAGETCDDANNDECDPLFPQNPVPGDSCNNHCGGLICKDPSRITIGTGLDLFRFHGMLVPIEALPVDLDAKGVSLALTAGEGSIFTSALPSGVIQRQPSGAFTYRNDGARTGGGLWKLLAKPTRTGSLKVTMTSVGDLSLAQADMVTHVVVGDHEWNVHGRWRRTRSGWAFQGVRPPAAQP